MDRGTVTPRGRLRRVQPQPTFGTAAFVIPKGVITGALVIGAAGLLIAIGISVYLVFLRRTRAVAGAKGRRRIPSGSGQADAEVVVEDRRWARGGRRGAGGGLLATLPSMDSTRSGAFRGLGDNSPRGGGGSFFSGLMGRLLSNLRATSRRDADDYDDGWEGTSTGRSTGPRFMASTVSGKALQVVVKTAAVAARHPDTSSLSVPLTSGAATAPSLPLSKQQQQQLQQQRQASYAFGGGSGNVSGGGGLDPTGQSAERYLHTLWESMHSTGPVVGSSSNSNSFNSGAAGGVNGGGGGSGNKSRGGAAGGAGGQLGRGASSAAGAAVAAPARLDVHDGEGVGAAGPGPVAGGLPPGLSPVRVGGGGGGPRSGSSTSGPPSSSARGGMGTAAAAAGRGGEAVGGGGTPLARISLGAGAAFADNSEHPGSAKSGGGGEAAAGGGGGGGGGSAGAVGNVGISLGGAGDSIPGLSSSYAEAAMVALMAAGGTVSNTPQRGGGGPGGAGGAGSVDPAVAWYGKKMAGAQQAAGSTSVTATSVTAAVGAAAAADAGPEAKDHLA